MAPVVGNVHYWLRGSYDLTTTVRTREISFPQAMSAITEAMPEADVAPTANGDMNLPATWNGTLRYVGSFRLRVEVEARLCSICPATRTTRCSTARCPSRARWSSRCPSIGASG
nr:hypothetical protein [Deltaproteobacteria bacterium]